MKGEMTELYGKEQQKIEGRDCDEKRRLEELEGLVEHKNEEIYELRLELARCPAPAATISYPGKSRGGEREAEFDALVLALSKAEQALQDKQDEYDESNLITREACQKLSEETDRVNELKIKDLEDQVTELTHALDTVRIDENARGLITQEECTTQKNAAISKLDTEILSLKAEIKNLADSNKTAWKNAAEEEAEKEKLQAIVEDLSKQNEVIDGKAESRTREVADEDLRDEVDRLKEELESARRKFDASQGATDIIAKLVSQRTTEKQELEKRITELEKTAQESSAVDPDSISIVECESQKSTLTRKLDNEKRTMQDHIKQLEEEIKLLKDTVNTLECDLEDCRDKGKPTEPPPNATLRERIAGLGARVTEVNKEIDSQGAELSKLGISSEFQQMRFLELENVRLSDEVTRLEEEVRTARNRRVASPYTRYDEKDAKIEELAREIETLNRSVEYYCREANLINLQYGRVLGKKRRLEERVGILERRAKERMEKRKGKKERRERRRKESEGGEGDERSRKDAKVTRKKAQKVLSAEKRAENELREIEIQRYESLVRERGKVETQVRKLHASPADDRRR